LGGKSRSGAGGGSGRKPGLLSRLRHGSGTGGKAGAGKGLLGRSRKPAGTTAGSGRRGSGLLGRGSAGKGGLLGKRGSASGRGGRSSTGRRGAGSSKGAGGTKKVGPLGKLLGRSRPGSGSSGGKKGPNSQKKNGQKKGLFGTLREKFADDANGRATARQARAAADTARRLAERQQREAWIAARGPIPPSAGTRPQPHAPASSGNVHNSRPVPTGGGVSWKGTGMPNPFENLNEAVGNSRLDVENARSVMDWVQNAPDHAEQHARMWAKHGSAIQEGLPISNEFGEALSQVSMTQRKVVEHLQETSGVFRRTHEEQLRKIESPVPNEDKWDISKNQG
jgi:hypothetical protein